MLSGRRRIPIGQAIRARVVPSLLLVVLAAAAAPAVSAEARGADGLGWLAGCWRSEASGGRSSEECWLAPEGGVLLGVHRDISPGGTAFEFLRIADEGEGLTYFASPSGRPATPFRLVEWGERRAVFANPEHDFPQRLLYWREGDLLRARAEGEVNGETKGLDFSWARVAGGW